MTDTCSYWLTKRNRNCLSTPVDGAAFCQVHLAFVGPERLPVVDLQVESVFKTLKQSIDCDKGKPRPIAGRCHYWLPRKRRFCKLLIQVDGQLCVEHSLSAQGNATRPRMPCPKDSKHSCYADQLENHLKKCNAKMDQLNEYYEKGINAGEWDAEISVENKVSIRDVEGDERLSTIEAVRSLHADFVVELDTVELFHEALREEVNKPGNRAVALKHLSQQASLIGHMGVLGLLCDGVDYIEFGAGKGGLSHWVQIANLNCNNIQYILVDRSSCRYKKDNYHRGANQGPSFQRLKIDIENLNIAKVPSLRTSIKPLIGIGKHLCGAATEINQRRMLLKGITVALCCHHRCDWKSYVGKRWFRDRGLSIRQFQLIVSMSAWATCTNRTEIDKLSHSIDPSDYSLPRYGNLTAVEREAIGIKCKQLLDTGRIHYLTERGFNAGLVYYVQRSLTLENVALTASRSRK